MTSSGIKCISLFIVLILAISPVSALSSISINGTSYPKITLPFSKTEMITLHTSSLYKDAQGAQYKGEITEGRTYGEEQGITGLSKHSAVDFALPKGFPVRAPVAGYVVGSYYNTTYGALGNRNLIAKKSDGSFVHVGYESQVNTKQFMIDNPDVVDIGTMNYGLGYFVQIREPKTNKFIVLSHLDSIDESVPYYGPVREPYPDHLNARGHSLSYTSRRSIQNGTRKTRKRIEQGELLGTVGTSGLEYNTLVDGPKTSLKKEQLANAPSRDEPHIHMRIHARGNNGAFLSNTQIDPFAIYGTSEAYPSIAYSNGRLAGPSVIMKNSIFRVGYSGEIMFAK